MLALLLLALPLPALAAPQDAPPASDPAASDGATVAAEGAAEEDEGGDEAGEIFFDALSVNVVNVDVYVTDKEGKPVTDLTRDDFELFENGRPVAITNFYAMHERASQRPAVAALPVDRSRELRTVEPPDAVPAEQALHLIVYVDNLFIRPFNRNNLLQQIDSFLQYHMKAGDRAMLATFDRTLSIRQPFTTDMRLMTRAIDRLKTVRTFGEQADQERRDVILRVHESQTASNAMAQVDFYARSQHHDIQVSFNALDELVSSLGGLPGRKALLFVSDGIPMTAAEDLYAMIDTKFGDDSAARLVAQRYRERRRLREIVAKANANRVTFYTLDAKGGYDSTGTSAEYGNADQSFIELSFTYDANRVAPLQIMAEDTGGLATIGTSNFFDPLDAIARDLNFYYSLGYSPPLAGDGRYYEIEVKVKRPGLKVRHRQGYRSKTVERRVEDGTMAALLYDAATNPLGVRVDFGRPEATERGSWVVPVEVRIPLGQVALLPRGGEHQGRLRVAVSVMNKEGDTSFPSQTPFPVVVPDAAMEQVDGQYYTYSAQLMMRPGSHQVAVGVHDEIADQSSFLRVPVRVGG